ncbi:MAG: hypothetical protein KDB00_07180, partial [Planctomycetales bacterium]|nr:hypothetical protein [Planctomycetales bacterium]
MPIEPESSEMLQDTCDSPDSPAPKVRRKRHWMISLIRIVLISYVVVLVMLVMTETQMLYPGAYMKLDGNSFQPASTCRPWEYPAEDGTMIVGRLRDRPGSSRTVLFFHGNGVKAIQLDHWIERLSQHLNANVMAAEYRGFQQ